MTEAADPNVQIPVCIDADDCTLLEEGQCGAGLVCAVVRADGTTRPPCLRTIDDIGLLCDVLGEPAARTVLLDQNRTLEEAEAVINAGAFQQWSAQVGEAFETMQWDRRRFGPRS